MEDVSGVLSLIDRLKKTLVSRGCIMRSMRWRCVEDRLGEETSITLESGVTLRISFLSRTGTDVRCERGSEGCAML